VYSVEWFETFVATRSPRGETTEIEAITAQIPRAGYPRVLEVGCGIGRTAGPLAARGYEVTGIDISPAALSMAAQRAPGPRYLALDQRHVGHMRWTFDAILVLWNSFGFVDQATDLETMAGMATILRPGGKVLFDMYHPEWMQDHQLAGDREEPGATSVRRWVNGDRCFHEIRYPSGTTDAIQFALYSPAALRNLALEAGLDPARPMAWWRPENSPSRETGRYQLVCTRPFTTSARK
jgi:SAM-dependent methyltransferase